MGTLRCQGFCARTSVWKAVPHSDKGGVFLGRGQKWPECPKRKVAAWAAQGLSHQTFLKYKTACGTQRPSWNLQPFPGALGCDRPRISLIPPLP